MLLVKHAQSSEANTANALSKKEISRFTQDANNLAEKRARLSDISWWMRRFAEDVARRVNKQDGCRGRVWEGRYKAQPLLDDKATLACLIYVDIWAARTASVGVKGFRRLTGISEPPHVRQASGRKIGTSTGAQAGRGKSVTAESPWLAPLWIGRANSSSPLAISTKDYHVLADWTDKNLQKRSPNPTPAAVKKVLGQLELESSDWCDLILNFGSIFKRAAGTPESLREEAKRLRVPVLYATSSPFKHRY